MNVKELKALLADKPDNLEVFLKCEDSTGFTYNLLEKVESKEIPFSEEPDSKALCKDTVLVLSEQ